jgi:D-alanyl-D-alanine carboxypeptidase
MKHWCAPFCILLSLAVTPAARAEDAAPPSGLVERLKAALEGQPGKAGVVGEALAVIGPGGRWAWSGAAGDARRGGPPMDPRYAFRIASVTKPFVAAAILRLMEERRIDIDGPIRPLISQETSGILIAGGYDPDLITVRQLLTHTSGLYDHAADPRYAAAVLADIHHHWTRTEQIRLAIQYGKPIGKPGERYGYSDTGYVVLGEIVERLNGQPIGRSVRELVDFQRLGLNNTWWEGEETMPPGVPGIADVFYGATDVQGLDPTFDYYGGGGLVSTVGDLARFYRALLLGEVFNDRRTLVIMMSVTPAERPAGRVDTNAVHAIMVGGHECWGHTGAWGGVGAYCPTLDISFAWTQNQSNGTHAGILAFAAHLADALEPPASSASR